MKKYREKEKLFLAEGWKFLQFKDVPKFILFEEGIENKIVEMGDKFETTKIFLSKKLFSEISSQENSQGVIVVYPIIEREMKNLSNNIIILNGVSDPGNLGTIIRVVEAAGFKDIILTKGSADCYNEKVVRSSMGSILNCNIKYLEEECLIEFLRVNSYRIIATTLDKNSISYNDLKLEQKNAFIFGNEGNGIKDWIINQSDEKIMIPIYGTAESLNVAIATALVMYKVREKIGIERGENV